MTTLEALVIDLETAKKLKAAGFPEGRTHWFESPRPKYKPVWGSIVGPPEAGYRAVGPAVGAQEIADQLPHGWMINKLAQGGYSVITQPRLHMDRNFVAPNMAEALAALWLKLHELPSESGEAGGEE